MKVKNLKFIKSTYTDPYKNLALEQEILGQLSHGDKVLLVYRNRPCVVMGRFQNPWLECDLDLIKSDKVQLVRRQSGGGCVYHDLNNINFCFLQKDREHQKNDNNQILIKALNSLEIPAYQSDRSDLLVNHEGVRKFSGSAFKQKKDSSFHHGTLLLDSDLTKLNAYLHTKLTNISTKSTKSVRAHVINLKEINDDINFESLDNQLIKALEDYYGLDCHVSSCESYLLSQEYLNELQSWKWIFAETPLFEIEIEQTNFVINLKIKKGVILDISFESTKDLNPSMLTELVDLLSQQSIHKNNLNNCFDKFNSQYAMYGEEISYIKSLIFKKLSL